MNELPYLENFEANSVEIFVLLWFVDSTAIDLKQGNHHRKLPIVASLDLGCACVRKFVRVRIEWVGVTERWIEEIILETYGWKI